MNTRILLLAMYITAFSSCAVYKSGQTPDDVYYSPAPARQQGNNDDSYVNVNQPKQGSNFQSYDQYQDNYRDDRFLRMSVGNPYYMSAYNSYGAFDWRYNSFYDGFNYGFGSPWNNYFAWNSFYNPYAPLYYGYGGYYGGGGYYVGSIKSVSYTTPISRPVVFNVSNYTNRPSASRSYLNSNYYNNANGRYNNTNNNNSYYNNNNGRSMYTPSNSGSNNSSAPSRSYAPSSSGGGGGSVSRPSRN